MHSRTCRILMPTDVPFWLRHDGAQQRIFSLVEHFSQPPFELQVYYLGPWTDEDERSVAGQLWKLERFDSSQPPQRLAGRIRWQLAAIENYWLKKNDNPSAKATTRTDTAETHRVAQDTPPPVLKLADYHWPFAGEKFVELVNRFQPQVVLCQYATMSYLVAALPKKIREQLLCILDTHDILHQRCAQFQAAGLPHWLEIDRQEELSAWNQFDLLLAIQNEEAAWMRACGLRPEVLVVGHRESKFKNDPRIEKPDNLQIANDRRVSPSNVGASDLRIGYLGSANGSNREALQWLLETCCVKDNEHFGTPVELVLAGAICNWLKEKTDLLKLVASKIKVRLLGVIDELDAFYEQVDVVVNPVELGTGLKIKNVEALMRGVPLLTTPAGAKGLDENFLVGCLVLERSVFQQEIWRLDRSRVRELRLRLAELLLAKSPDCPYRELEWKLLSS